VNEKILENSTMNFFRVFLGLCENEKYRGTIVAGGGAKVFKIISFL
jgi:hypothetical protein